MKKSDIATAIAADAGITFAIGECVFIRTVTFHLTGRIAAITNLGPNYFLHLTEAAWIADNGRFTQAIDSGALSEIEPVKTMVRVAVSTIVDVYSWDHPLPRAQK